MKIDTGDTVKHAPSGETWVVACVRGNELSYVGWPEGFAKLSDCVLLEKASDDKRQKLLIEMSNMPGDDHRKRFALEKLSNYFETTEE
jgi:ADP-ribose pyrophosphatase YjhB (NUDIX family)